MPSPTYDVIIAGAGPVGLTLALALSRANKKVLLLEQKKTLSRHSRAPAIWPRTQEILDKIAVSKPFQREGIKVRTLKLWDTDNDQSLVEFPIHLLKNETKFPHLLVLPQNRTERLLLTELKKEKNTKVLFNASLESFRQNKSSVTAKYRHNGRLKTATAQYLIGCDGAHSVVRKKLRFKLHGETYDTKAALADIRLTGEKKFKSPRLTTKGQPIVAIMIADGLWRFIIPFHSHHKVDLTKVVKEGAKYLFGNVKYRSIWKSEFSLHRRLSSKFVKGRIALAGDAAHLNSPAGGQGMNAGMKDADILSTLLLEALETEDPKVLKKYSERRDQINKGVNKFTNTLTKFLFYKEGKALRLVMAFARLLIKLPFFKKRLLRRLAMLKD